LAWIWFSAYWWIGYGQIKAAPAVGVQVYDLTLLLQPAIKMIGWHEPRKPHDFRRKQSRLSPIPSIRPLSHIGMACIRAFWRTIVRLLLAHRLTENEATADRPATEVSIRSSRRHPSVKDCDMVSGQVLKRGAKRRAMEFPVLSLPLEPLTVRIPVAVQLTGIGRSKLYELIAAGEVETVKVGASTLVTVASLRRMVQRRRR
jgi:hypothetical protein